ncbi:MAG: hypothetical protein ACI3X4_02310 [Bacteroidaceae bacterium]
MKKIILLIASAILLSVAAHAQIGYQVTLLNSADGTPRANERVSVTVKITNKEGKVICESTSNETTDKFGLLSLSVGDSNTFDNVDFTKSPFFIEATVDSIMVGRTQILSVPIAEYAKRTGALTVEKLCSKDWITGGDIDSYRWHFSPNGKFTMTYYYNSKPSTQYIGTYVIYENHVYAEYEKNNDDYYQQLFFYIQPLDILIETN